MQAEEPSIKHLLLEIERLRQEVEGLQREKADLEIMLETTTAHADAVEALLYESNKQLQAEIIERQRTEAALQASQVELQSLLAIVSRDKADLEIILETTTEHGDIIEDLLHNQCFHDPLTGLFNRRYMENFLEKEIHRTQRKQQPLCLMMIDIDHFKRFNNNFGHEAGDIVLKEVGLFLQSHIRNSDIACRYGGDELMLILPEASLEDTRQRAVQLLQGVKHLNIEYLDRPLGAITLSIGIGCFPEQGKTGAEILQSADAALYRAKAEGRDRAVTAESLKKLQPR